MKKIFVCGGITYDQIIHTESFPEGGEQNIYAADYIQMSSSAMKDWRPYMERLISQGKNLIVCTHGKDGATALTAEGVWHEEPIAETFNQARVDSNGAGDAFFSGVLYGFSRGLAVDTCLKLGTIVSGPCITSCSIAHPELSPDLLAEKFTEIYGGTYA